MNKTKVDDMLIEMIEPKLQEINKKFSDGKSLTQDDINTLLLKSQYNHINHLDQKLDEVTESVVNLEHRFDKLEQKVNSDIKNLEEKFENLEQKFIHLEQKVKSDIKNLEEKFDQKFENLEQKFVNLEQKVNSDIKNLEERLEATIQRALNKNMTLLIIVFGVFLTIFKIIDKF